MCLTLVRYSECGANQTSINGNLSVFKLNQGGNRSPVFVLFCFVLFLILLIHHRGNPPFFLTRCISSCNNSNFNVINQSFLHSTVFLSVLYHIYECINHIVIILDISVQCSHT